MHKRNPLKIIIQLKVLNLLFTESFLLGRTLSKLSPLPSNITATVAALATVQSLSHVQLCDPTESGTPDSSALCYLLEFAQTHVH